MKDYYSITGISQSLINGFVENPYKTWLYSPYNTVNNHKLIRQPTDAMIFGSYCHDIIQNNTKNLNSKYFVYEGDLKTRSGIKMQKLQQEKNKIAIFHHEIEQAKHMKDVFFATIKNVNTYHSQFKPLINSNHLELKKGIEIEKECFISFDKNNNLKKKLTFSNVSKHLDKKGKKGKIRMDFYLPQTYTIIDYKTVGTTAVSREFSWQYTVQAAYYTWFMEFLTGTPHEFFTIFQSVKELDAYTISIKKYDPVALENIIEYFIKPSIGNIQKFLLNPNKYQYAPFISEQVLDEYMLDTKIRRLIRFNQFTAKNLQSKNVKKVV